MVPAEGVEEVASRGREPPPPALVRDILSLLSPREKMRLVLVILLMNAAALVEMIGVASVLPFLGVLSDPGLVERNRFLAGVHEALGSPGWEKFFFLTGVTMLVLLMVSNALSGLSTWALLRFSWMRNHTISMRLLANYLHRPYTYFLSHNSSELSRNILSEVEQVVANVLVQLLTILQRSLKMAFILAALMVLNPGLSTVIMVIFGGTYARENVFASSRRSLQASRK